MMRRRISHERGWLRRAVWQREARLLQTFEARVCTDFDLNLMCSALDGERLVAISPGARVVEVPNGVDIDYFCPSAPAPQRRAGSLVFAGRLNWYPNASALDWFAEAIWPRVKEQVPDASMTVIGKNATREVRDWAAREPRVELTGFVPDVRPYLEEAAVYVCPIFDGGGTKLKILDAMAMGCAIVAHPIACEGINVSDGVELLMASTPEDFARQVRVISADRALASRLGAAARRRAVAEYSFTSIGARLDRLVSAVADGSPVLPC